MVPRRTTSRHPRPDRVIGKPTVDLEADEVLADLAGALDTLLQPTPAAVSRAYVRVTG